MISYCDSIIGTIKSESKDEGVSSILMDFFARASERRVLLIVGVCYIHLQTSSNIFSSSHLQFLSSHLLIFSSSHLLIFTSSHLHIVSSSHVLIFSSSHLHSSHLHICSSHIFSCPLALLLSCPLALLPSCPLALFSLLLFCFSLTRRRAVPTRHHETQPFRTKWG